jgi:xanthine dehydrogenase YagR molybdenum-binding subunit
MRDGKELVGWGMATGVWEALQMPVAVRIVLTANGHAEVFCAASDIGTGTYTIMTQVAADALGLPIESISVKLADSTLPQAPVEGGSWMAASSAHAVLGAAEDIRQDLARLASTMPSSPLAGVDAADVILIDGTIASNGEKTRAVSIADAMRHGKLERLEKQKLNHFTEDKSRARNTHSAVFAEVKVDEQLGVIRVTRVVSAVAAGRILNTKTGRSQIMGGVVWGIGMALHGDGSPLRPDHECEHRRVPHPSERRHPRHRRDLRRRARRPHQPAWRQGPGRNRHRRRPCGDRKRRLSRHRQTHPSLPDHAG